MNIVIIGIVSFLTGVIASMGLGGGMILIVYLTIFTEISQISAQGVNLIFFIPIAIFSLILHTKNHLIEWKKIAPSILGGVFGVIIGSFLASGASSALLRKFFAVFLIFIGIKELFRRK